LLGGYIIATDLGSQSIKTAVFDTEGRLLSTCRQSTKLHTLGPGAIVYDGDEFYKQTVEDIKLVLKNSRVFPDKVLVLSFMGMGGGIIGVDEKWQPTLNTTSRIPSFV